MAVTDKERAVIEAARKYVWHWSGFHQPDNWGAERNNRAFALAQALAALDAPEACGTCGGINRRRFPRGCPDLFHYERG